MKKKIPVKRVKSDPLEDFFPMLEYLKRYLPDIKPGDSASTIDKKRYANAVRCVKEMRKGFVEKFPDIPIKTINERSCCGWVSILFTGHGVSRLGK